MEQKDVFGCSVLVGLVGAGVGGSCGRVRQIRVCAGPGRPWYGASVLI